MIEMLANYLEDNIIFMESVSTWEESIKTAAQPLLNHGNIIDSYVEDMIHNVNEFGPYIVIVPGVAMPHAKNNGGVKENGVSFLKLESPVLYPEEKEVKIVMVLAAEDSSGHLDLISELAGVLADEDIKNSLEKAESKEEILRLIASAE
jgi:mannitol PTS system EIIA component